MPQNSWSGAVDTPPRDAYTVGWSAKDANGNLTTGGGHGRAGADSLTGVRAQSALAATSAGEQLLERRCTHVFSRDHDRTHATHPSSRARCGRPLRPPGVG